MTDMLAILTTISQVLGFPAALALAWAAFVIRDQGKRISKLEGDLGAVKEKTDNKVSDLYDLVNSVARDVSWVKGRMEGEK